MPKALGAFLLLGFNGRFWVERKSTISLWLPIEALDFLPHANRVRAQVTRHLNSQMRDVVPKALSYHAFALEHMLRIKLPRSLDLHISRYGLHRHIVALL